MTEHVLLAQTKIGFLTGGRGYSFQELSLEDKQSQREEAFARATVAPPEPNALFHYVPT